ncbi:LysR family transcriptional regulator [Alicycliphilus sp. T452]
MKFSFFDTLEAVLRSGSLAGAARLMNVTPSAVSMQMKQLEAHFGRPLFDRAGLTVRPTPLAREIVEVMREPMQRVEALRRRHGAQVDGLMRLGVIETMQSALLPGVVAWLRAHHPALQVRPVRGRSVELLESVKAGRVDAAILVQPATGASRGLVWYPLLRKELVLLAPPDSSESRIPALFRTHDWIRFDPETNAGRLTARWMRKHVPGARPAMDLQSVQAVVAMVSAGLGVSIVQQPDAHMTQPLPVRILRLGRDAPSVQVALMARQADAGSRKLEVLRDAVASVPDPTAAR